MSNQTLAQQLAQALLLEQVKFIKKQLLSNNNLYLQNFVHQVYTHADRVLLKDVVQLEQLNQVVRKYAFELNLGSEILEFIGLIAQKIHHLAINTPTTLNDLLSDESYELWQDKILELEQLRHYIQSYLQQNAKIQAVSLQLANQILESNTPWLDQLRKLKINNKGVSAKLLGFFQEQQQTIELKLEQQLAQTIIKQLGIIITLPNEELAEISQQIWADIKTQRISGYYSQFESIDIEEFFILVYETWKELRQTEYIQSIVLHVVEAFYESFADYDLQSLLQAVGLSEDDLHEEANRFAPFALKALDQAELLDTFILALIEPFYHAESTLQVIQNQLDL